VSSSKYRASRWKAAPRRAPRVVLGRRALLPPSLRRSQPGSSSAAPRGRSLFTVVQSTIPRSTIPPYRANTVRHGSIRGGARRSFSSCSCTTSCRARSCGVYCSSSTSPLSHESDSYACATFPMRTMGRAAIPERPAMPCPAPLRRREFARCYSRYSTRA